MESQLCQITDYWLTGCFDDKPLSWHPVIEYEPFTDRISDIQNNVGWRLKVEMIIVA